MSGPGVRGTMVKGELDQIHVIIMNTMIRLIESTSVFTVIHELLPSSQN